MSLIFGQVRSQKKRKWTFSVESGSLFPPAALLVLPSSGRSRHWCTVDANITLSGIQKKRKAKAEWSISLCQDWQHRDHVTRWRKTAVTMHLSPLEQPSVARPLLLDARSPNWFLSMQPAARQKTGVPTDCSSGAGRWLAAGPYSSNAAAATVPAPGTSEQ